MAKQKAVSAGLLLFRRTAGQLELFLAHPGGPFWTNKDVGAWSIPKGVVEADEDLLTAARREFREETGFSVDGPFVPLGSVQQKSGKQIHAWACEGNVDASKATSNKTTVEWPPKSGRRIEIPEVDRCEWVTPEEARTKLNPAQVAFIDRLEAHLAAASGDRNDA
jgi:predicted NUDIX family NTP pyrophosphohydrolase